MSESTLHVPVSYAIRERMGAIWRSLGDLSTLLIDKVAVQKQILEGELGIIGIRNEDRVEIRQELDLIKNRRGRERNKSGIGQSKRPLLTSTE